jgi:hypothetical protein
LQVHDILFDVGIGDLGDIFGCFDGVHKGLLDL